MDTFPTPEACAMMMKSQVPAAAVSTVDARRIARLVKTVREVRVG